MTFTVNDDLSRLRTLSLPATTEWQSACTARHSLLLEGPESVTEAVLLLLTPHLREPVAWTRPGAPFEPPTGECGALVVQDAAALDEEDQARLLAWLDHPSHRRQVVATTPHALFPLVACGLFDEALYYRLNVMLLPLDDATLGLV